MTDTSPCFPRLEKRDANAKDPHAFMSHDALDFAKPTLLLALGLLEHMHHMVISSIYSSYSKINQVNFACLCSLLAHPQTPGQAHQIPHHRQRAFQSRDVNRPFFLATGHCQPDHQSHGMLARWACGRLPNSSLVHLSRCSRPFTSSASCRADPAVEAAAVTSARTRNIGIIAHIDAVCSSHCL